MFKLRVGDVGEAAWFCAILETECASVKELHAPRLIFSAYLEP
jgi:hypothetical protein